MRERRIWEEDGNNCVWVLARDDSPEFGQIEIIRPDGITARRKRSGALWKLED